MSGEQYQRVSDILDIMALKARYCELADAIPLQDQAAVPPFVDLFTLDVQGDYGRGPIYGRDALVGFLITEAIARQAWMFHAIGSPQIDIDGDNANGRWTVTAHMKPKDALTINTFIGRYSDEFRRTSDGWKISAMRFEAELSRFDPYSADSGRVIFSPKVGDL